MELHVPEYIQTLVPYLPGKPIEETQREFRLEKVVKLASNENPLGPSPKAMEAIQNRVHDLHRYPDSGAFYLKQKLSQKFSVTPQNLILGNGSNEVIEMIIRTFSVPGDMMVTSQAAFIAYKISAQLHGVRTVEAPLNSEMKWSPEELLSLVRENDRVRMVFIAHPNNPTGTFLNRSEMMRIVQGLKEIRKGNTVLVIDSAYQEYVDDPNFLDPIDILKDYSNTIVLRTFSKVYGLAGLRIGYGISGTHMISHLEKMRQPFNMNSLALAAAEAALDDLDFVRRAREINRLGMQFWQKKFETHGVPYWKSQGNFILMDTQKIFGRTGPELFQECLKEGVIFRPVANYGLKHALRISIGLEEENEWAANILFSKARSESRSESQQ